MYQSTFNNIHILLFNIFKNLIRVQLSKCCIRYKNFYKNSEKASVLNYIICSVQVQTQVQLF